MSFELIDDASSAERLASELDSSGRIALDCEAAGFHRYSDRLCLVQITTDRDTFVVDPFAVDSEALLRDVLEDPAVPVVMHGADFDLRLLDRDLGIRIRGLRDTQAAAALLGEPALGLASLLKAHLGVAQSKKYQRADWARRPLPADMLTYAAADTRHLLELLDLLEGRLEALGRLEWAEEEYRELESIRFEEDDSDPVTRVKGAHELDDRDVTALREALDWRDRIARERDKAPFRIAGDRTLLAAARRRPRSPSELASLKGMNGSLARAEGPELLERFRRVERLGSDELRPYPPPSGNGRGRPPPEVEERMDRLKGLRNARAEEFGLGRGTLLPNATLLEIAHAAPEDLDELRRVPGVKRWQVEALGDALLDRVPA